MGSNSFNLSFKLKSSPQNIYFLSPTAGDKLSKTKYSYIFKEDNNPGKIL